MATADDCEKALFVLAERLAAKNAGAAHAGFDRSLSCTLRDLKVIFTGRFDNGRLVDIRRSTDAKAQIRLEMTSDDLLRLVDGELNVASAWAGGRVKVGAGVRDLIRLRSIF